MVSLTHYTDASEFLAKTRDAFLQNEPRNALILGICERLLEHPERQKAPCYFATVEQDSTLLIAAAMTPPHGLVIYHSEGIPVCEPGLVELANHLQSLKDKWAVPTVQGIDAVSDKFAELWCERQHCGSAIQMQTRGFVLRQVELPQSQTTTGTLRVATMEDFKQTHEWETEFHSEIWGKPPAGLQNMTKGRLQDGFMFFWEIEGKPVCMAGLTRPTAHGISVAPVYTPKELRGKGYATSCVAALSQLMLDKGKQFVCLFTDLSNPTSNKIYTKIGYKPTGDFRVHEFKEKGQHKETMYGQ
eukprot:TRINITY_DN12938_c0_g1_i1.p1 TRINITY_DN12938_c0_g1~~TRINITY_DN12938_c0_g1_i1.p1  ORF type:complete len:301 (-),score=20.97 TRINITY_DN12938_c0_g1_i1:96-998(-)